jgi:hypothetical protein
MAQITTKTSFYGVPTKLEVNTNTGRAEVFLDGGIFGDTKVAEVGANNDWKITNLPRLTRNLNNRRSKLGLMKPLTESEVNKAFYSEPKGARAYNNERAAIFKNPKNYDTGLTGEQIKIKQTEFFKLKIPGAADPITGNKISNDGKQTVIANPDNTPDPAPAAPAAPAPAPAPAPGTTLPEGSLEGADTRGESLSGDKLPVQTLRYPKGSPPPGFPFDFIQITSYKYVPAGLDYINTPNKVGESVESRYGNQTAITTVSLPMQPNLSESHSVGWGGDSLDPIKAIFAKGSMTVASDFINIEAYKKSFEDAGKDISALGSDPATIAFVAAYFAGQAVGANITGRTTGQVINPNMELLFSGPSLRTFNFQFRLTPRDDDEAKEIRQIIKSFKANMAVQRSTSNLFLMAPNIFKLKYISGDGSTATEQHPFLNKFKPCAMTGFNVNYTPDGSYMTFENKSLTSYDISMSFSELEPIYQDDYTNDYNSNDMGF